MVNQYSYRYMKSLPKNLYKNAIKTFKKMQTFGKKHYSAEKREYKIPEMMEGDDKRWWDNLTDSDHQKIGKLIAHGFPEFAKLSKVPIYIAFDHLDSSNSGVYRLTSYSNPD